MACVPIESNSESDNQAMDQRPYHYHEHHHHHHYYHHQRNHQHEFHSNSNKPSINEKPTYQVYCRADYNYALTIRDGKVVLAPSNPSDPHQHWYKEHKFGTKVKDAIGLPSFALVNKATGQAIKHSAAASQPVQLTQYDPNNACLDHSILYTEASIREDGDYKAIRMVNNIHLLMDADHAVKECGGVKDGNIIILWEWNGGDNQRWMIVPY